MGAAHEALSRFKPDLVVARHVFAHIHDWKETMEALDCVCSKDTLVAIEVPNSASMLRRANFDQVYHEHLSYITPYSMFKLLEQTPFRCFQLLYSAVHGGSSVYFLRKHPDTHQLVAPTKGIKVSDWNDFESRSNDLINQFSQHVGDAALKGKRVVGYGAQAKSTVWIQAAKLDRRHITCLLDGNPRKIGTLSPGSDIPVVDEAHFQSLDAQIAIVFAWNYMAEITKKNAGWKGRFVEPCAGF
jgi:novobiocin biosynthesis protein NovU/D-mycarose 3-C-methyltransferase